MATVLTNGGYKLTDTNTVTSINGKTGSIAAADIAAVLTAAGYKLTDTDTNTWRGIQNNLTSTSATESLSAAQGKTLREHINDYVYFADQQLTISSWSIAAHSFSEYTKSYTPPTGYELTVVTTGIISGNAWVLCSNAYYDYSGKKLHILANNTGNSAVTLSASAPIIAIWRIGFRKKNF
jgi:hypothetical protein